MTDGDDADREQAIRQALVRLLPRLRRFCLALTASQADADDVCQAVCERAITRLDQWIPGTRLDSWLYRIAQNIHRNTVRDRSNRLRLLEDQVHVQPELAGDLPGPTSDVQAIQMRQHVLDLPEDQRQVLILICVEGHSYKECAELLDLPVTTVTNRLFQARTSLRRTLADETDRDDVPARSASA